MDEEPEVEPTTAVADIAAQAKEDARGSGRAWAARDIDRAADALQSEGGKRDFVGGLVADAFLGQNAAAMVEAAPFEAASSSILDQPILVVFQSAKAVELADEYHYALPDGTELALGKQTNQGMGRKLLRLASNLDSKLKTVIEVAQNGKPVFTMERKGSIGKNTMVITDARGSEVGTVAQTSRGQRRASFALVSAGSTLATMKTGHVEAGQGYDIVGPDGEVLAYVRRVHEGVLARIGKSAFSEPDNYVLRMARKLDDPLRTLVVATPMAVDSAVNQDRAGIGLGDVGRALRRFT
jgi:hypothetical protein